MFDLLPPELVRHCYAFDKTFHDIYKNVLKEMFCPELTALLWSVKGLRRVMFCERHANFFLTDRGLFLVCDEAMRYILADYFNSDLIMEGVYGMWDSDMVSMYYDVLGQTWQSNFHTMYDMDMAATNHGWPALLQSVDGSEKECKVGQTTYYVYQYEVDGCLMNDIRRSMSRIDIKL